MFYHLIFQCTRALCSAIVHVIQGQEKLSMLRSHFVRGLVVEYVLLDW